MVPEAAALHDLLVVSYRPFLAALLQERRWPQVTESIDEGERWLDDALQALLVQPFAEQQRSPLEVFQEAMAAPTSALLELGIAPPDRDPAVEAALPGDVFDLAPASPAQLGEEVLAAHLAWGSAKAAALRPAVVVLSGNLLDLDRIESEVSAAGYVVVRFGDAFPPAAAAFVDLENPQSDDAIKDLSEAGVRVVAFGPHVDDQGMLRARALGASDAVPRSRFFGSMARWLPPLV